jgi:hypothetical protein
VALQPFVGPWPRLRFVTMYKDSMTAWMGDQPVVRPLPTHRTAQTQQKRAHTYMPQVGFEPATPSVRAGEECISCLRPHGHRDQLCTYIISIKYTFCNCRIVAMLSLMVLFLACIFYPQISSVLQWSYKHFTAGMTSWHDYTYVMLHRTTYRSVCLSYLLCVRCNFRVAVKPWPGNPWSVVTEPTDRTFQYASKHAVMTHTQPIPWKIRHGQPHIWKQKWRVWSKGLWRW